MKTKSRWIAFVLAILIGVGLLPATSLAAPPEAECRTWAEVQNAFTDGKDVKLMEDIAYSEDGLFIENGKDITLDLNGYILSNCIRVKSSYLTVKDSSNPSKGEIRGISAQGTSFDDYSKVTINGGNITDCTGPGIYAEYSIITINGGSITDNTGPGIFAMEYSKVIMNGGSITGNTTEEDGGGVRLFHSDLTLNGGRIADNSAGQEGGGICAYPGDQGAGGCEVIINGGSITGNTAELGGAISGFNLELTLRGGSITGNTATEQGGGIAFFVIDGGYDYSRIYVSGSAVVSGNKTAGTDENIFLDDVTYLRSVVEITGALNSDAKLGITTALAPTDIAPVVVAKGGPLEQDEPYTPTDSDRMRFFSDEGYGVRLNDENQVELYGNTNQQAVITFDADGGTPVPDEQRVNKGEKATQPVDPSKAGFDFDGWYDGNNKWNFDNQVNENLTLKANWIAQSIEPEINETNFPDANFRKFVKQYDTDNDGTLQMSELSAVTIMNCGNEQISNMTGIEHFTSLTFLVCNSNQLTELNVSNLTNLESLWCYDNQLTGLDVSKLTNLTDLSCFSNQLIELDVSNLTNLKILHCGSNQLSELDISACADLWHLNCYNNQLTDLDLSNLTNLINLYCGKNPLKVLNISHLIKLTELDCGDNQLTELDVSNFTDLTYLWCYDNQLTELAIANLTNLTDIRCRSNQLTELDVSHLTNLDTLSCSSNQLPELDVSACADLWRLDCSNNQLTSLDVSDCVDLRELGCSNNQLRSLDVSPCVDLWQLSTCPQAAGEIQGIREGNYYKINLGSFAGVDIANIKAVTLANGDPLPAGYNYDATSGILTIEASMEQAELKYVYDTKANRDKLDVPPYEDYGDIIDSTPDMEVYFTWVKSGILTGWVEEGGEWYFYDETGEKVTGWYTDSEDNKYYLDDETGARQHGWYLSEAGDWYYFHPDSGRMCTDWLLDRGRWYFLNRSTGVMQTGWLLDSGRWYFLNRSSGIMQTGWLLDSGRWYFLNRSSGAMQTGWLLDSGRWYFLNRSSGAMQTGWLLDSGRWYFLNRSSGAMQTGWLLDSGKWYFLNRSSGAMQTGWLLDGGKWYFLDRKSGVMKTGWVLDDGKWYYFDSNGVYLRTG
ncbi:MAG: leucine-rich repeat domain-containing protein [Saccharofermentanales bacterium]